MQINMVLFLFCKLKQTTSVPDCAVHIHLNKTSHKGDLLASLRCLVLPLVLHIDKDRKLQKHL